MDLGLALGVVSRACGGGAGGGLKAALIAPAVVAVPLIAGLWRKFQRIDVLATIPHVEIQLLRSISICVLLPAPSLESVARELESPTVSSGTAVIKEGERGDSYYVVAEGEMAISHQGRSPASELGESSLMERVGHPIRGRSWRPSDLARPGQRRSLWVRQEEDRGTTRSPTAMTTRPNAHDARRVIRLALELMVSSHRSWLRILQLWR
jgi:hypothetical protein